MSDIETDPSLPSREPPTVPRSRGTAKALALAAVLGLGAVALFAATVATVPYWAPAVMPHLPWAPHPPPSSQPEAGPAAAVTPTPQPAANDRLDLFAERLDALSRRLDELARRPDAGAQMTQQALEDQRKLAIGLDEFRTRLDKDERVMQQEGNEARTNAALVLAAMQLEGALDTGMSFNAPLAVLRSLGGADPVLAAPLAALGRAQEHSLPTRVQLGRSLDSLAREGGLPVDTGAARPWWRRVLADIRSLVTVHRVAEDGKPESLPPGPERAVARAQAALADGDLGGAAEALRDQPEPSAAANAWIAAARSRLDAEQAAADIETVLTRRMAATPEATH